jgi:hypothetical protein
MPTRPADLPAADRRQSPPAVLGVNGTAIAGTLGRTRTIDNAVSGGGVLRLGEFVAVPPHRGCLAAGVLEVVTRRPSATRGAPGLGQQQAQAEHADGSYDHAVEEQSARGAGHVITEHSEAVGEGVLTSAVAEDTGDTGDDGGEKDDEPYSDDHADSCLMVSAGRKPGDW